MQIQPFLDDIDFRCGHTKNKTEKICSCGNKYLTTTPNRKWCPACRIKFHTLNNHRDYDSYAKAQNTKFGRSKKYKIISFNGKWRIIRCPNKN